MDMDGLHELMSREFGHINQRFDDVDRRFDAVDDRFREIVDRQDIQNGRLQKHDDHIQTCAITQQFMRHQAQEVLDQPQQPQRPSHSPAVMGQSVKIRDVWVALGTVAAGAGAFKFWLILKAVLK